MGLEFFTETEIKKDEQGNEFEMEIDSYWVEYKKTKMMIINLQKMKMVIKLLVKNIAILI